MFLPSLDMDDQRELRPCMEFSFQQHKVVAHGYILLRILLLDKVLF